MPVFYNERIQFYLAISSNKLGINFTFVMLKNEFSEFMNVYPGNFLFCEFISDYSDNTFSKVSIGIYFIQQLQVFQIKLQSFLVITMVFTTKRKTKVQNRDVMFEFENLKKKC